MMMMMMMMMLTLGVVIADNFTVTFSDSWHTDTLRVASVALAPTEQCEALQYVYRVYIVVACLTYVASAWRGFTKASDRQRINLVIDRLRPTPRILLAQYYYYYYYYYY